MRQCTTLAALSFHTTQNKSTAPKTAFESSQTRPCFPGATAEVERRGTSRRTSRRSAHIESRGRRRLTTCRSLFTPRASSLACNLIFWGYKISFVPIKVVNLILPNPSYSRIISSPLTGANAGESRDGRLAESGTMGWAIREGGTLRSKEG